MDEINIYIATSAVSAFNQDIAGHFIIELLADGIPSTYPPPGKASFIYRNRKDDQGSTPQSLAAMLLTNAVVLLSKVITYKHLHPPENITVYLDKWTAAPFVNGWFTKWVRNGYARKDGQPISQAELWKGLNETLERSGFEFVFSSEHSSYYNLMHEEASKALIEMQETAENPREEG